MLLIRIVVMLPAFLYAIENGDFYFNAKYNVKVKVMRFSLKYEFN